MNIHEVIDRTVLPNIYTFKPIKFWRITIFYEILYKGTTLGKVADLRDAEKIVHWLNSAYQEGRLSK